VSVRYAVVASRGVWRSLVARFVRDEEAVGSNPATPTVTAKALTSQNTVRALVRQETRSGVRPQCVRSRSAQCPRCDVESVRDRLKIIGEQVGICIQSQRR
jgi:hypothetical protein